MQLEWRTHSTYKNYIILDDIFGGVTAKFPWTLLFQVISTSKK